MTRPGPTPQRPYRAARTGRGLLAALVGVLLILAGIVVGAVPSAAQNAVGASTPAVANTVGSPAGIGAGQRLGNTAPQPQIVVATAVAAEDVTSSLSYTTKITKQMGPRGWTEESVADTVKNPAQTHSVWDFTTGDKQPATAYVQRGGGYVVVNDTTGEIVQVSDLGKANWKPVWDDPRFQR